MRVFFAADHAGFELKEQLVSFVQELGYDVEDCGADSFDENDDYPQIIARAAREVSAKPDTSRAVVLGGSGQGEALVANRFKGVRANVYYGEPARQQTDVAGKSLDIITSMRIHGNSNVLALGARFLNEDEAKQAVKKWLETDFPNEERHKRRIKQIDELNHD